MARKKRQRLPKVGDAYALRLKNGYYVVCRVVREVPREERVSRGFRRKLEVVCSDWYGKEIPDVNNKALRSIQTITSYDRKYPAVQWLDIETPPRQFKWIGFIEPASRDCKKLKHGRAGFWTNFENEMYEQWRWDHEREAFLAEIAEEKARELREEQHKRKRLKTITLSKLLKHSFFPDWVGFLPARAIHESRGIMKDSVKELIRIGGKRANESERLAVLKKCIDSFNIMDEMHNHFIDTLERESICSEFELLVYACGLGHLQNLAEEWRDW